MVDGWGVWMRCVSKEWRGWVEIDYTFSWGRREDGNFTGRVEIVMWRDG